MLAKLMLLVDELDDNILQAQLLKILFAHPYAELYFWRCWIL